MQLDLTEIEEIAKLLYIRALKLLPDDIKDGFVRLQRCETDPTGRSLLATMVENIAVAERDDNLLCQDTGIPIYTVTIGRDVTFDGAALKEAIRRGCERATREHPLRSSVVHPVTRRNEPPSAVPVLTVTIPSPGISDSASIALTIRLRAAATKSVACARTGPGDPSSLSRVMALARGEDRSRGRASSTASSATALTDTGRSRRSGPSGA